MPPSRLLRGDRTAWGLAALVAVGAALRFSTLGLQSFWDNEAYTVAILKGDLGHVFATVARTESTPPLYYVLAWAWAKVFGTGEVGVRSLSALIGTAAIPVVWLAAREAVSRRAALVAAGLASFSPVFVWYSQEARAYSLLILLSVASLVFVLRARRDPSRWNVAAWGVVSAAALLTHYFAVFLIVPEAVLLLRSRQVAQPARRRVLLAVAGVGAVGVALVLLAQHQLVNTAGTHSRPLPSRLVRVPLHFLVGPNASALQVGLAAVMVLIVAYVVWEVVSAGGKAAPGAALVAVLGGLALTVPVALALAGADLVDSRNLLPAAPPLLIAVAAALAALPPARAALGAAVLCVLGLVTVVYVDASPSIQRTNFRGAAQALGPPAHSRAVVVAIAGHPTPYALGLYLPRSEMMPSAGEAVSELDLIGFSSRVGSNRSPTRLLELPREPAPGFQEFSRIDAPTFTMRRYRAGRPTILRPGAVLRRALDGSPGFVLDQDL